MIPLVVLFLALDIAALALLGPITPADTAADVARLYGDDGARVLASRLLHCLGLAMALGFFGLVRARLREEEEGAGALSAILFGGFVALVPVELVRNVIMAALALRFDDLEGSALGLHVVAVLLGPVIAFPVAAALVALAVLRRSALSAVVATMWVLSGARLVTTSTVVWFVGFGAFVATIALVIYLSLTMFRTPPAAARVTR